MLPHTLRVGPLSLGGAPEWPLYEAVKVKSEMPKKGDICQGRTSYRKWNHPRKQIYTVGSKAGELDPLEPFETEVPSTRAM